VRALEAGHAARVLTTSYKNVCCRAVTGTLQKGHAVTRGAHWAEHSMWPQLSRVSTLNSMHTLHISTSATCREGWQHTNG
jgi:hypothetical protein